MRNDVLNAVKMVEESIEKIVKLDNQLNLIDKNFDLLNNQDKEVAFEDYKRLYAEREALSAPLAAVEVYFKELSTNLSKHKKGLIGKLVDRQKLKNMKDKLKKRVVFSDSKAELEAPIEVTDFKKIK